MIYTFTPLNLVEYKSQTPRDKTPQGVKTQLEEINFDKVHKEEINFTRKTRGAARDRRY